MSALPVAVPVFGSTTPRLWTPPLITGDPGPCGCGCALTPETSYGFDVDDFARDVIGTPLDPWQRFLVIHAGELLPDGRPRFRQVLVLISRQQGKTHLGVVLTLYWLFVEQQKLVLGTSTIRDTAKESWRAAVATAEGSEWLAPLMGKPRSANGEETLETLAGCRYRIAASNRRGGRGMTINRLILDELREHLTNEAVDAAIPATNAVWDAQIYAFTNQGGDDSVVLHAWREAALAFIRDGEGDRRLGMFEWSAPDGADPTDPAALLQSNPSCGIRTDLEMLIGQGARAKAAGGAELASFRTEILCQRVNLLEPAIDPDRWLDCADDEPPNLAEHRGRVALCLDVSLDETHATLVAAAELDSVVHVEVVKQWDDMATAMLELPGIVEKVRPAKFGWFPAGPAAALTTALSERKNAVNRWPPRRTELEEIRGELAACCMGFAALVRSGKVRHSPENGPLLTAHVTATQRTPRGDAWVFGRRDSGGPIDATYAAAGAAHLARLIRVRPQIVAL